jgi:tetratricopeptide (TPR) repeat protein
VEPVVEKLNLGVVALDSGELEEAIALFEDVLAAHRRNGVVEGIGFALVNLGLARYELGDHAAAAESFEEARDAFAEIGFGSQHAHALQGLAGVAAAESRYEEAARLLGAAAAKLDEAGWNDEFSPELTRGVEAAARAALGDAAFESAFAVGRGDAVAPV